MEYENTEMRGDFSFTTRLVKSQDRTRVYYFVNGREVHPVEFLALWEAAK